MATTKAIKPPTAKESIKRSRKIPTGLKDSILKLTTSSSKYNNAVITGLKKPDGMKTISKNIDGCSLGADEKGFFVYTHRARSKSFSSPLKIDKKTIDYIETTG